jgi:hypothetical protein
MLRHFVSGLRPWTGNEQQLSRHLEARIPEILGRPGLQRRATISDTPGYFLRGPKNRSSYGQESQRASLTAFGSEAVKDLRRAAHGSVEQDSLPCMNTKISGKATRKQDGRLQAIGEFVHEVFSVVKLSL